MKRCPNGGRRAAGVLLLSASLLACADDGPPAGDSRPVGSPPSIRAADRAAVQLVRLTPEQADELKIRSVTVAPDTASYPVVLPGEVSPAPERFSQVSAPISGRIVQIYAHEGEAVGAGQPLLALESLEFANLVADFFQASAEEAYQQRQVERLRLLVESKITPRSQFERAEADLARARAGVSATLARLRALGITAAQLRRWSGAPQERPLLVMHAPIAGAIDRHEIDLGESVTAYQPMMTILDTRQVLVRGFVSPEDAPTIRPGDEVIVRLPEGLGPALRTQVTTINPAVDPQSRAVTVNVLTATRDGWPMPGQVVRLEIGAGRARPVLRLPLTAVHYEGEQAVVFVRLDAHTFEKRPVQVERLTGEEVIVRSGVQAGEAVAVTQVFSLKALGRFEQYAEE